VGDGHPGQLHRLRRRTDRDDPALIRAVGSGVNAHACDAGALGPGDQAALGVLEVLRVVELEFLRELLVGFQGCRRGIAGNPANTCILAAASQRQQRRGNRDLKSLHSQGLQ
jgi:hypothetical protein